jgi:hypothetical protein
MRVAKILTLLVDTFGGAWLLMMAIGLYVDISGQTQNGFYLTSPPSHPLLHIVAYLTGAIGLQALSAWILIPPTPRTSTVAYCGRYTATVAACLCGSVVAGALVVFVLVVFFCSDC